MSRKVFLDTTKLEKLRNKLIFLDIVTVLLLLFSWKATGHRIVGVFWEVFIDGRCLLEIDTHSSIVFSFFWLGLFVFCTLQIITLQAWIRMIEDAQQYHGNRTDKM